MIITDNKVFVSGDISVIEVFSKHYRRYLYVIVDTEDLELIKSNASKVYVTISNTTNYSSYKSLDGKKTFLLHRLIMKPERHLVVDHINHNGIDNRKKNLRNVSYSENNFNKRKNARNPLWDKMYDLRFG